MKYFLFFQQQKLWNLKKGANRRRKTIIVRLNKFLSWNNGVCEQVEQSSIGEGDQAISQSIRTINTIYSICKAETVKTSGALSL